MTGARRTLILPVLLVLFGSISPPVRAEVFCVGTAGELQSALDAAEATATGDSIFVQRGTYVGNFNFGSYELWPITIRGGYDLTCANRVEDPSSTIIDANGSGTALSFYQHAGGGVHIEGLTIQNGGYHGVWVRLMNDSAANSIEFIHLVNNVIKDGRTKSGVYMMSEPGANAFAESVLIYDNVIVGNYGERSGITVSADWALPGGSIVFRNNLIAGNVSTDTAGGVTVINYDTGNLYFTNNTIIDNETLVSTSTPGGLFLGVGTAVSAFNNIIHGNQSPSGPADIYLRYYDPAGTGTGFNNLYSVMDGTWNVSGANQDIDPELVSRGYWHDNGTVGVPTDDFWVAGDSHLSSNSACVDGGSHGASGPGALPAEDFEGDPRVIDGDGDLVAMVDIGADERSGIFADGFESGGTSIWSSSFGEVF